MEDIINLDSSDDEWLIEHNTDPELPIIMSAKSMVDHKKTRDNGKRKMVTKIGDCILSPIKKPKMNDTCIEISDDSDDSNYVKSNNAIHAEHLKTEVITDDSKQLVQRDVPLPMNGSLYKSKQEPIEVTSEVTTVISLIDDVSDNEDNLQNNNENVLKTNGIESIKEHKEIIPLPSTSKSFNQDVESTEPSNSNSNLELFNQFIKVCENIEQTDNMMKVIAKLQKYYNLAHKDYKNSSSFTKLIQRTSKLVESKQNHYFHIKDFIDELRIRRQVDINESDDHSNKDVEETSDSMEDVKNLRIEKLQRAMKKINRVIKELETKEEDFEDDYNSVYLLKDRYERRLIKIYNKLCEITGEKPCAGRAIKRKFCVVAGVHPSIDKCVQDLVNKKKEFPDYHDVLKVVRICDAEHNLKMGPSEIEKEARKVFQKVGTELQKRREADYYTSISDYVQAQVDPAVNDPILQAQLKQNHKENSHKIVDIYNKYVEKAEQLGLKEEEVKSDDEVHEYEEKASDDGIIGEQSENNSSFSEDEDILLKKDSNGINSKCDESEDASSNSSIKADPVENKL